MSFNIQTSREARELCYNELHTKIEFLPIVTPECNIQRLREYKYCICPQGNGIDTHRLWEALYLGVVPILLRNTFTENIQKTMHLPLILLDSWNDLNLVDVPDYNSFNFNICNKYLSMEYYSKLINANTVTKTLPNVHTIC